MYSTLLLHILSFTSLVTFTFGQTDRQESVSVAKAALASAIRAGHAAVTAIEGAAAADPLATSVAAFIATAIPSRQFAQQTADFRPIDYLLPHELPAGALRSYEKSVISAESSAYHEVITSVLGQYPNLFPGRGKKGLNGSEVLVTTTVGGSTLSTVGVGSLGPSPTATTTNSSVSVATPTSTTSILSSSGAQGKVVPERVLGMVAGIIAGGFGFVAAIC